MDDLLDASYLDILTKAEVLPYPEAQTDVNLLSTVPFRVSLRVELAPVVELGDYQSLRVPYPEITVTDEEVQNELEYLRRRMAVVEPAGRPAERGDAIVCDHLEIRHGEEVIYHNHGVRLLLEEDTSGLPAAVIDAFVGMNPGESKEFDVVVPEGDSSSFASLAGETLYFEVVVSEVNTYTLPDLDDAFASTVGPYTTLDEVRAAITNYLMSEKRERSRTRLRTRCVGRPFAALQGPLSADRCWPSSEEDNLKHLRENLRRQGCHAGTGVIRPRE